MTCTTRRVCLAFALPLVMCCGKSAGGDTPGREVPSPGDPIEAVDGQVLFHVRRADGISMSGDTVRVNSLECPVLEDGNGSTYILAGESAFGEYSAVYAPSGASGWYGASPTEGLLVPHAQFAGALQDLSSEPQFALYGESSGNVLTFTPVYGVISIRLSGEGSLASVKLESAGAAMAGKVDWHPYEGTFSAAAVMDHLVVNCTAGGAGLPLTASGATVEAALLPGSYPDGLTVTMVSMDHKVSVQHIPALTVTRGETVTAAVSFSPQEECIFWEGFDTFVWGGDIMGGSEAAGFAPSAQTPQAASESSLTGREYALSAVGCTIPGTGYIQQYSSSGNASVGEDHLVSSDYVASRNIPDWQALIRCQEYQGCIAVGAAGGLRGWLTLPELDIPDFSDIRIELDWCYAAGADDDFDIRVLNAGTISSCTVDGTDVMQDCNHLSPGALAVMDRTSVSLPSSDEAQKSWHHLSMTVEGASSATLVRLISEDASSLKSHGFYVDNISVSLISSGKAGSVRLLYWNIQNGMWADLPNSFSNFSSWVRSYAPDICVWCEAKSNYGATSPLPEGWGELAATWGHSNVAGTGSRYLGSGDSFPQEVTSSLPLEKVMDIPNKRDGVTVLSHGGGLVRVSVSGQTINIVPLHLLPRTTNTSEETDSYQLGEIIQILEHTVLSPDYASEQYWIVLGDFNSHSPADSWYYDARGASGMRYQAQSYILANTDLVDIIAREYPGTMCLTTRSSRIDFIYVSPALASRVRQAGVVADGWARPSVSAVDSSYYDPSDHRPIIMDFDL